MNDRTENQKKKNADVLKLCLPILYCTKLRSIIANTSWY